MMAGAFDRVNSELLIGKFESFGLNEKLLKVTRSLFQQRQGFVIASCDKLSPMLFVEYGWTGGGLSVPPSWNAFFGSFICAISCCGFAAVIYADDCNAFHCFPHKFANAVVQEHLSECQASVHAWGRASRILFDAGHT